MKILILTAATGGGHIRAAVAIEKYRGGRRLSLCAGISPRAV